MMVPNYIKNARQLAIFLRVMSILIVFSILTGELPYWLLVVNIFILIGSSFLIGYLAAIRSLSRYMEKTIGKDNGEK